MTVYFDMDRVLTDFARQAEKYNALKKNERVNWVKVFLIGSKFWSEMDFFPGAKDAFFELLSYCSQNGIYVKVLSSVRIASGRRGKIKWCRDNLLLNEKDVIIVKYAEQKADFASEDCLLIDDSDENIRNFISNGGHGFKFRNWNDETCKKILNIIKNIRAKQDSK